MINTDCSCHVSRTVYRIFISREFYLHWAAFFSPSSVPCIRDYDTVLQDIESCNPGN